MYDKHPVYPHHQDLFWAHEPYKTVYVLQRILTTLLLVPCWVAYYGLRSRKHRPRPSWSIAQIVIVKFMKRISRVVEVAGVTFGTRDPTTEPDKSKLKETRFEWVPPLPSDLRTGIVDDPQVECKPVGTFVWPKEPHPAVKARKAALKAENASSTSSSDATAHDDLENAAADAPPRLIGVYLHGGGYCHYSAHEHSGTSRVPRRLIKDGLFQEIYAVEYRLLQHAPVPGALQDAAAVYANIVVNELGATKGLDGRYYHPDPPRAGARRTSEDDSVVNLPPNSRLSRAGDYAQATDERPELTPLSPPSKESDSRKRNSIQPMLSGNDAVPNIYISNADSSDSHASETHPLREGSIMLSPAMSPKNSPYPGWKVPSGHTRTKIVLIGDSAGGNLVLALARWIRDEGVLPPPDGMLLLSPSSDPSHTLPQVPASRRPRPHENTDYLLDTPEPRALLSRTFLGHHPPAFVYSPYISPSSEWVISTFHGPVGHDDLEKMSDIAKGVDTRAWREGPGDVAAGDPANSLSVNRPDAPGRTHSTNPFIRDPSGQGLFTNFPRALIVLGDAERLEREVIALEKGMERDGVRVRMVWAKDACHDILILAHWDERVREGVWMEIEKWTKEISAEP